MEKKDKPGGISRRKFIKEFSTGVVSGTVLIQNLHGRPINDNESGKVPVEKDQVLLQMKVNGREVKLYVKPRTTLVEVLRNHLELTGTKVVCNHGECGACTVLLDGVAVYSCQMLALDAASKEVTTIEGLMNGEDLHPIQQAFIDHDGLQCGFCTPGQIIATQAILLKNKKPSREEIIEGLSGNLCRCSAYPKILDSAIAAAEK
jgi:xanthine dehydrogenase YagT iron-sulfur-binding subunit